MGFPQYEQQQTLGINQGPGLKTDSLMVYLKRNSKLNVRGKK